VGVRCASDIPKALLGKKSGNGPVSVTESKHPDLKLRDLGSSEVTGGMSYIAWAICGSEYALLERDGRIRDVILFPAHSKRHPGFLGACVIDGRKVPDSVLAVLDNVAPPNNQQRYSPTDSTLLPAASAWRVDSATARYLVIPAKGVRCPRGGIFTADGGS
jgi:hypothetical protein